MLQLINISQARAKLSDVIARIQQTGEPTVIIQDSKPVVVIYPYEEEMRRQQKETQDWQDEYKKALEDSKKSFQKWLAKKGIDVQDIDEDQAYELIKQA